MRMICRANLARDALSKLKHVSNLSVILAVTPKCVTGPTRPNSPDPTRVQRTHDNSSNNDNSKLLQELITSGNLVVRLCKHTVQRVVTGINFRLPSMPECVAPTATDMSTLSSSRARIPIYVIDICASQL